jgi:hypothetical protein
MTETAGATDLRSQSTARRSSTKAPFSRFVRHGRCSRTGCVREEIRNVPTHFVVMPGDAHVIPEVEVVVNRTNRYWVVEKTGHAAEVSRSSIPGPARRSIKTTVPQPGEHARRELSAGRGRG